MTFTSLPANFKNVFSTGTLCKQFGSSSDSGNFHGCNSFAFRRETTGTNSLDLDQLHPFHKWDFSYRREFVPEGSQVFPFIEFLYVCISLVSTLGDFF